MLLRRVVTTLAALGALTLTACSTVIVAGDLEYTFPAAGFVSCSGHAGPVAVNIEGKCCIDSTEITYAQYLEFLAAAPPEQDAFGEWNVTAEGLPDYEPMAEWKRPDP